MVIALSLGKADVELFVGVMMIFTTPGKLFSTVLFLFFFLGGLDPGSSKSQSHRII